MLNQIEEADSFVSNFVSGNEISESFYEYIHIFMYFYVVLQHNC